MIRWTEQITISALHNLENPDLNDSENAKLYGDCYRKHGHDYHLQIELLATIDARSGLAIERSALANLLREHLFSVYNGQFLNQHFDCTSGEALSYYFYNLLKAPIEQGLKGVQLKSLQIQETRKNWFSYSNL